MKNEIYTAEQEGILLEEILKDLGIALNHNYFRAEKGVRPLLHKLFSYSMIYRGHIMKFYFLVFTEDQLILLNSDGLQGSIEKNISKINYEDIKEFTITRRFIYYCVQFEYNNKRFYFYIDADGVYSFTGLNYSDKNFHFLKERNFMGLLKN